MSLPTSPQRRAALWVRNQWSLLGKFGIVGIAGVVINLGVFNLLRLGPLGPGASVAGETDRVVTAKVLAAAVSVVFAWIAHRYWTYRNMRAHAPGIELMRFAAVNVVATGVEAAVVAVTHHGLGWDSALADNVWSLVGIGLGTVARFIGFRLFVFTKEPATKDHGNQGTAEHS